VPTFIFTFEDVVGATMPDFAAFCATCAETSASATAPADIPAPVSLTKSRRFMKASIAGDVSGCVECGRDRRFYMVERKPALGRGHGRVRSPRAGGRDPQSVTTLRSK
jgi:hypothetical protein